MLVLFSLEHTDQANKIFFQQKSIGQTTFGRKDAEHFYKTISGMIDHPKSFRKRPLLGLQSMPVGNGKIFFMCTHSIS